MEREERRDPISLAEGRAVSREAYNHHGVVRPFPDLPFNVSTPDLSLTPHAVTVLDLRGVHPAEGEAAHSALFREVTDLVMYRHAAKCQDSNCAFGICTVIKESLTHALTCTQRNCTPACDRIRNSILPFHECVEHGECRRCYICTAVYDAHTLRRELRQQT